MTKEQRIKNIKETRNTIDQDQFRQGLAEIVMIIEFGEEIIENYSARIKDLVDIANELERQGFSKAVRLFTSDSWDHQFGFVRSRDKSGRYSSIIGVGFEAGGAWGDVDFCITEQGLHTFQNRHALRMIDEGYKKFAGVFGEFEHRFYEYIDNLENLTK